MRRGKTAAGDLFVRATQPSHSDVLAAGFKFHQMAVATANQLRRFSAREVHGDDRGEMPGPLAAGEIQIVARGHNVPPSNVGFVNPVLVEQYVVLAPAAETAIQNVISPLQGEPRGFANDLRARAQLSAQYADAAKCGLRGELMNDSRHSGAMTESVRPLPGRHFELRVLFNHRDVIREG